MSIEILEIKNLYWDNNSYLRPNSIPSFEGSQTIRLRPTIYGFMGGRTHLYGDSWNYARYKGVYYFLKPGKCIDAEKNHYEYYLVRDIWMNIISKYSVEVRGIATTTNRFSILETNLNRCFPVSVQPAEVRRVSLSETKISLKDVQTKPSSRELYITCFDNRELQHLVSEWKTVASKYKKQLDLNKYQRGNSPIFLFGDLKPLEVSNRSCWKEYVRINLNSFLDGISDNEDLVISKVQSTESAGRLQNHYCITYRNGGIGQQEEESVFVKEIDLSALEDIVPINPKTLQSPEPNKQINNSVFSNISFTKYQQDLDELGLPRVKKIRRKIYYPITQSLTKSPIALAKHYSRDNNLIESDVSWNFEKPQEVNIKHESISKIFLFWLDNVDFQLNYNRQLISYENSLSLDKQTICKYLGLENSCPIDKVPYPFPSADSQGSKEDELWSGTFLRNKVITPLGFLIFKPFDKDYLDGYIWNGFKTKKIKYISGIRKSKFIEIVNRKLDDSSLTDLPYPLEDYYQQDSASSATNWNKYYFNILNGLDILFQPNQSGYTYAYRSWRQKDRTSNNYSMNFLTEDSAVWKNNTCPFLDKSRQILHIKKSRNLIDKVIMYTCIDVPYEIDKGDYLFNSLEYWIDNYDTRFWTDNKGKYEETKVLNVGLAASSIDVSTGIADRLFLIEDFLSRPKEIQSKKYNTSVICTTREGKFEVRQLLTFSQFHELHSGLYSPSLAESTTQIHNSSFFGGDNKSYKNYLESIASDVIEDEQIVMNVDGKRTQQVNYFLLKKLNYHEELNPDSDLNSIQIKALVGAFLKGNGYRVSPDDSAFLFYEIDDLSGSIDLFFDLKGTDWYLHMKQGRISLIAKKPYLFEKIDTKISVMKDSDDLKALSLLSTVEKINQKCVLNIYSHQRLLNTKFTFSDDKFAISVNSIKPTHKKNPTAFYCVNLKTDWDVIEKEIVEVQKTELEETAAITDYVQLENLRVNMRRADRTFEISTARDVVFATEKENESYRRRQWDLSTQKLQTWISTVSGLFTLGIGGSLANVASNLLSGGTGLIRHGINSMLPPEALSPGRFWNSTGPDGEAVRFGYNPTFKDREGFEWNPFKTTTYLTAANSLASRAANLAVQHMRWNETASRIEKDREFAFRDIAFKSLQLDMKHRDAQEDAIRNLNKLSNVYSKGLVNNMDVIKEFNKENNLEPIYLTVFTPNSVQLKYINQIVERFGVDCSIPDVSLNVHQGMPAEVIRFEGIEDENVFGISNKIERKYLISILEMGIKIISEYEISSNKEYICANPSKLVIELEKILANSGTNRQTEHELRKEITELKSLTHDSTEKQIKAEKEITELKNSINAKEKQHIEKERELEQKLNDERRLYLEKKTQYEGLQKEHEKLKASQEELQSSYDSLKEQTSKKSLEGGCELLKKALSYKYDIEIVKDQHGWTNIRKLLIEMIQNIIWLKRSGLYNSLPAKYPQLNKLIKRFEEFEKIQAVDFLKEIVKKDNFDQYYEDLQAGTKLDQDITTALRNVEHLENIFTAHSVKALLDQLNWETYNVKEELEAKAVEDPDLNFFFKHVYPGNVLDLYKNIFGDPLYPVLLRRYSEDFSCEVDGVTSSLKWLKETEKDIDFELKTSLVTSKEEINKIHIECFGKYLTTNPRYFPNIVGWRFNNSYYKYGDAGDDWLANRLDQYGRKSTHVKISNYYTRYVGSSNRKKVFHISLNTFSEDQKLYNKQNLYWDSTRFSGDCRNATDEIVNNVRDLLKDIDRITVSNEFLNQNKNRTININMVALDANKEYGIANKKFSFRLNCLKDLKMDFLKVLKVLSVNKITPNPIGKDNTDSYDTIDFLIKKQGFGEEFQNIFNSADILDSDEITFDLGLLFNDGYECLCWIYRVLVLKGWFVHPWKLGEKSATYRIFKDLEYLETNW